MTGKRANKTTGLRDNGTTRLRDDGTAGLRDDGTARRRDYETTRPRDHGTTRLLKNPGVLRRSQAFSAVRGCARQCEAVRGSLASEWCSSVADKEIGLDG